MINHSKAHKEPAMVLAHFSKQELNDLDRLQGKKLLDPRTGIRHYRDLGNVFKNPHIKHTTLLHARAHHAKGGRASLNKMKKEGRFGDTEMAYIPRQFADHLDQMIGGKSINPHSKHREYFLAGLMGGIGKMVAGAGMNTLSNSYNQQPQQQNQQQEQDQSQDQDTGNTQGLPQNETDMAFNFYQNFKKQADQRNGMQQPQQPQKANFNPNGIISPPMKMPGSNPQQGNQQQPMPNQSQQQLQPGIAS